jgi:predicted amidophosphoribosyltransferase
VWYSEWRGKPISLHLDHINGDPSDNRIENLRILCPNCHSQTPTYSGKNKKTARNNLCADCGGPASRRAERCLSCHKKYVSRSSKETNCKDCQKPISRKAVRCKSCAVKKCRGTKIDWPTEDVLEKMVEELGYSGTGRELGVSDNAVRKHLGEL